MSDEENLQVLDVQMRSDKDGYIGIMVGNFSRMAYIIASEKMLPSQMYHMAGLIIAMIPGQDKRKDLLQKLKNKMVEIKAEKLKEGYSEKDSKDISISSASIFIVGEATDFLNEHLGITKEARIEIDFAPDLKEFLETIQKQKDTISKLEEKIKLLEIKK